MARFEKIIDKDYKDESETGMLSIAPYKTFFGDMKLGDHIHVIDPTGTVPAIYECMIHRAQWRIDGLAELYKRQRVKSGDKAIVDVDPEKREMTIVFERKDKGQTTLEDSLAINDDIPLKNIEGETRMDIKDIRWDEIKKELYEKLKFSYDTDVDIKADQYWLQLPEISELESFQHVGTEFVILCCNDGTRFDAHITGQRGRITALSNFYNHGKDIGLKTSDHIFVAGDSGYVIGQKHVLFVYLMIYGNSNDNDNYKECSCGVKPLSLSINSYKGPFKTRFKKGECYNGANKISFTIALGENFYNEDMKSMIQKLIKELSIAIPRDIFNKVEIIGPERRIYFSKYNSKKVVANPRLIEGTDIYVSEDMTVNEYVSLSRAIIAACGLNYNNILQIEVNRSKEADTHQEANKPKEADISQEANKPKEADIPQKANKSKIAKYLDKQSLALTIHKSIRNTREKDIDNELDMLSVDDIAESISCENTVQIIDKSILNMKKKANKRIEQEEKERIERESKDKLEQEEKERIERESKDKLEREEKERIETQENTKNIKTGKFIEMIYDRLCCTDYMYRELQVKNYIISLMAQQWVGIVGVNGTGKDSLAILISKLCCENYEEQVLEFTANKGLENDNRSVVGYQHALTDKFQKSDILRHISKAQKSLLIPFFIIISEANVANLDSYLVQITAAVESASTKITLNRYRHNDEPVIDDINIPKNLFFILTMNKHRERKDLSLMDLDRMNVINFDEPYLRRQGNRSNEKYKPILSSDPNLVYLFKKLILNDEFRNMSIRDAYYNIQDYQDWENTNGDIVAELLDSINSILKKYRMIQEQDANRNQDAILKYLYISRNIIDEKFAIDLQISQKVVTKLEYTIDENIDAIIKIKELLIGARVKMIRNEKGIEIKGLIIDERTSDPKLLPDVSKSIEDLDNIISRMDRFYAAEKAE